MTELLRPFAGYLPQSKYGSRVVGPPGVTLTEEQRASARDDPLSFRFTAGRKAGCPANEALEWLAAGISQGALLRFADPSVLAYRQEAGEFVATGLIGDLSLEAYRTGRVKRHEKTIAKTQQKMADYMRTTRIYGNPAVTAIHSDPELGDALNAHTERPPDSSFITVDGISHELWLVEGDEAKALCQLMPAEVYITDGHHRLAAAALVASNEGEDGGRIPVGVFTADQFRLRSFARCIADPDFDHEAVIAGLRSSLEVDEVPLDGARPRARYEFGAKVSDRFFRIRIPDEQIPSAHYASLNTNLLQGLILGPVFGIERPRLDKRLRFVPDLGDLQACADADAWFLPFPLEAADVMTVADSAQTMPAKSTWFAPKLPSGLVIRPIDES